MSPNRPLGMLLAVALTLPGLASAAGSADFKQQLVAEAQRQQVDLKTNRVEFSGQVVVTQGSVRIDADRLEVIRTADGTGLKEVIAYGNPARYQQQLEDGTPVKAEGEQIRYLPGDGILRLTGNAQLTQQSNLIRGKVIRYDLTNEKLFAESDSENRQDRVTTIFLPEPKSAPQDNEQ